MRIERWDLRRDGPLKEMAVRQKLESRGYAVSSRHYPAGAMAAAHTEEHERADALVSGLLKITLDEESAILMSGDIVFIPRGTMRRVEVLGPSPAHCLEAVRRKEPA